MKSSYKKHLYTTTLSLSAAVLLSVIGHGQVSADSVEAPQTEPSTRSLKRHPLLSKL